MNKKFRVYFFACLAIFACNPPSRSASKEEPSTDSGKVVKVIDGDTYDLLTSDHTTLRIRMYAIDAPERGMPYNKVAKKYLSDLCFEKSVRIVKVDEDRHGRIVAKSYLPDGRELGAEMIRAGYAWHFKQFSSDTTLARLEEQARANRLGLWADSHPLAPWEVRKMHREGISTRDSF